MGREAESVRSTHKYHHRRLLHEIKKIKTSQQIEIIQKSIQNALETYRITYEESEDLLSKLSKQASKIGAHTVFRDE